MRIIAAQPSTGFWGGESRGDSGEAPDRWHIVLCVKDYGDGPQTDVLHSRLLMCLSCVPRACRQVGEGWARARRLALAQGSQSRRGREHSRPRGRTPGPGIGLV
jgi:hypothetical protein